MVTAKKQKKYPGCLAYAVNSMFYSVVANQRQPGYACNVLQRRFQPRPTIICIFYGGVGGVLVVVHGCSLMTIDLRIPSKPERSTSGFHRPGG